MIVQCQECKVNEHCSQVQTHDTCIKGHTCSIRCFIIKIYVAEKHLPLSSSFGLGLPGQARDETRRKYDLHCQCGYVDNVKHLMVVLLDNKINVFLIIARNTIGDACTT